MQKKNVEEKDAEKNTEEKDAEKMQKRIQEKEKKKSLVDDKHNSGAGKRQW